MKKVFLLILLVVTTSIFAAPNYVNVGTIVPSSSITRDIKVSAAVPDRIWVKVGDNNISITDLNYFEAFLTNFKWYASAVTENNTTVVVRKQIGIHRSRNYMVSSFVFRTNGTGGLESCFLVWRIEDGLTYNQEIVILSSEEVDTLLTYFNEAKRELNRMNSEIKKFSIKEK